MPTHKPTTYPHSTNKQYLTASASTNFFQIIKWPLNAGDDPNLGKKEYFNFNVQNFAR
jgi:PKD repeat protein